MRGRYVNVSENGFRVSRAQGPWPPAPTNFNVFVFGGSTMFGTWLPDEQTVSSFLQAALARRLATNVCVYNFGMPYYYSTQERLRFERLLGQGIVPHAAVFVDGANDFNRLDDTPEVRERFVEAFEVANKNKSLLPALVQELPLARLIRSITARVQVPVRHDPATLPAKAARVIATYRENKLMIESLCAAHGVAPVFVWQPIPRYNYDLKYFPWYHTRRTQNYEPTRGGLSANARALRPRRAGHEFPLVRRLAGRRARVSLRGPLSLHGEVLGEIWRSDRGTESGAGVVAECGAGTWEIRGKKIESIQISYPALLN